MHGQLDIFAFINQLEEQQHDPYAFCWDNDINEIHYRLTNLAAKHRLSIRKTEWEIWEHVPHFGYRMTFTIDIFKKDYTESFLKEMQEIVDFAKGRKVDLHPVAPIFFREDEKGYMLIFSMFEDKERQRRK